jgi:hypothetical protein
MSSTIYIKQESRTHCWMLLRESDSLLDATARVGLTVRRRVGKNPGFFKKTQPGWVFLGFIGFYWVLLGFIGYFWV